MFCIDNRCTDVYFNLAVEEYLLKQTQGDYFVIWQSEPSVVMGKNQSVRAEVNEDYRIEKGIRLARRFSGGGAVYHDKGNINLTFIETTSQPLFEDYLQRIVGFLETMGVTAYMDERLGIYLDGNKIVLKDGEKEIEVVKTEDLKLLGKHNFENVMAAVAMAYYDGVSLDSIRKSICEFTAVAHRIEYVTEKKGVVYYNDSKGTNPDAAIKGIQAMNRPTLLIGGGYDKQSGYDEWIEAFDGKVRYLVLIGQTKEKIKEAAEKHGFHDIILCEDLKEAVKVCEEKAQPGDAVLLSPACASWGQFDNYEQRGDMFKEYVRNL